ncbi:MAG: hypothetical protein HFJ66_09810 [Eggerthellaceae bacterium]|nr:hypothetical protein [Eggerthellaceae bacterium]
MRDRYLRVRVTEAEEKAMVYKIEQLGMTKSEYLRTLLALDVRVCASSVEIPEGQVAVIFLDTYLQKKIHRQLRAFGYHYNQGVHALNTIVRREKLRTEEALELIFKCLAKLDEINLLTQVFREDMEALERRVVVPHANFFIPENGGNGNT